MAAVVSAMDVVVYENTFTTSSETQLNNVPQGTPAVLWTNTQNVMAGTAPAVPKTNSDYLQIAARKETGAQGRNILTAPIANFNTPFASKLSEIEADSVVWTFNMRYNYEYCSGFDDSQRGIASVLVSDNEDLTEGNGYAVVLNTTGYYRLVRFTDGLDASENVSALLSTPKMTALTDPVVKANCRFMAIKVVYVPATNEWRLFYAPSPTNAFVAPAEVEWTETEDGAVVDATHTDKSMTHFGFLNKYSGNVDATMFIKNYQVMAYGYNSGSDPDPDPDPDPQPETKPYVKIYSASFTAESQTSMANHQYGVPQVLWTNTKYNYGTAEDCADPTIQAELNVPGLKAADSKGRNILTAPMSGFDSPWTSSLKDSPADSIIWMFNMRYNYDYTAGFDNEQRGIATVMVMDNEDMMTANGYAIVSNASYYYRLVRFDGGLSANGNITALASTEKLTKNDGTGSSNKRYLTFRIVYTPATDTWRMYYFANTTNAYVAPADVTSWTLAAEVVDATHTDKQMTHFGFMNNYVQGASFNATLSVKNYSLGAHYQAPGPATSIDAIDASVPYRKLLREGRLVIIRDAKVYDVTGRRL